MTANGNSLNRSRTTESRLLSNSRTKRKSSDDQDSASTSRNNSTSAAGMKVVGKSSLVGLKITSDVMRGDVIVNTVGTAVPADAESKSSSLTSSQSSNLRKDVQLSMVVHDMGNGSRASLNNASRSHKQSHSVHALSTSDSPCGVQNGEIFVSDSDEDYDPVPETRSSKASAKLTRVPTTSLSSNFPSIPLDNSSARHRQNCDEDTPLETIRSRVFSDGAGSRVRKNSVVDPPAAVSSHRASAKSRMDVRVTNSNDSTTSRLPPPPPSSSTSGNDDIGISQLFVEKTKINVGFVSEGDRSECDDDCSSGEEELVQNLGSQNSTKNHTSAVSHLVYDFCSASLQK